MRRTLAIAFVDLRRLFRDRSNVFFVLIFPLALVLVLGVQFGGEYEPRVGVLDQSDDAAGEDLAGAVAELDGLDVRVRRGEGALESMRDDLATGRLDTVVVVPPGIVGGVSSGDTVGVEILSRPQVATSARARVEAVVAEHSARLRAAVALWQSGVAPSLESARERVVAAAAVAPTVDVVVDDMGRGEPSPFAGLGQFDLGASQQLLLFMFLTALNSSAALIQTRRLGVARRILSTPTSVGSFLVGQGAGRFAVAVAQGGYIMLGTLLVFGVDWGDPVAAVAILVAFGAVSAGAGMLVGSVMASDQQAIGVNLLAGLGMAALGGCMVPLEVFSDTMRRVAHATPHAWALDAFATVVRRDGGVGDIVEELTVLTGFAAALLIVATWELRRRTLDA